MASPSSPVLQKLPSTLRRAYSSLSAHLPRFPAPHSSRPTGLPMTSLSSPVLQLPMASPNSPALQKLHSLAVSTPDYCDNLYGVLHEEDYRESVANLADDDLTWLVDYLDKVCELLIDPCIPFSTQPRLLTVLNLPARLIGSACASSEPYVAPRGSSRRPSSLCLSFSMPVRIRLPKELMVKYSTGLSMDQLESVSSV